MTAFVELVLSQGYQVVTTREIARRANVGRSTLYLHFAGKEALLKESLKRPSSGLAACVEGAVRPQDLAPLLDHFRDQRILNRVFFAGVIRSLWVKSLAALIEGRLPARTGGTRSLLPRSLLALMVAEMQIALITHWLDGRSSLKSEVIAAVLITNTRAMVSGA